eukprot:COSAG02_NODE_2999_length_7580_cov_2.111482_9_plen_82_part_00
MWVLALLAAVGATSSIGLAAGTKPHVLLILADDVRNLLPSHICADRRSAQLIRSVRHFSTPCGVKSLLLVTPNSYCHASTI